MLKTFKIEVKLNAIQIEKVYGSMGICRFLYNQFIAYNKKLYKMYQRGLLDDKQKHFCSGYDFDKYVNNKLAKQFPWIKNCPSKARKQTIMNADLAFRKFFTNQTNFPKFKKKKQNNVSLYFPKNGKTQFILFERHKIKIPKIGWVFFKEYGYLPKDCVVNSITLSTKANKYFVSILTEIEDNDNQIVFHSEGIGIDLGIKELMTLSNGKQIKNINKNNKVRKISKKIKRLQRSLSRKQLAKRKGAKNTVTNSRNIGKNILKIQKQYLKLSNIKEDYINKNISDIVKLHPKYIVLEDLNIKGMMKNRHLSKAIAECNFYSIRQKLHSKCNQYGIELRIVDKFYPSSKMCSCCGSIKKDLKLKDRTYICTTCGLIEDRDINASINLMQAKEYKVL